MGNYKPYLWSTFFSVVFSLTWLTTLAVAAPFTSHFDDLIADLNTRANALSNSTDKVEQKQFKTIGKVLKQLNGKASTSLAADIKNLGSVAKALFKSFPTDFTPPGGSLDTNLETAVEGFASDVQTQIDATKSNVDALAISSCKLKTQATLDTAQTQLDAAEAALDFSTASKLLGSALKTASKAASSAAKCNSQGGGGGGGGSSSFSCMISGAANDNFSAATGNGFVLAQWNNTTLTHSMTLYADLVDGPGTYPIDFAATVVQYNPLMTFFGAAGTITFTTADFTSKKLVGSFAFAEPQQIPSGTGTVTVTSGQFNINDITRNDSPVRTDNVMVAEDNQFSFYGPCTGIVYNVLNSLLLTGQNEALTYRTLTLVVANPAGPGTYPVGLGSNYTDQHATIFQTNVSGTVYFSTLNIPQGTAEGTFTFSATQSSPPGTNTVNVINGHFKNSNIITQ
jgi:hypothetical protein